MNRVGLSIAPANARAEVKRCVQHVTESAGGQGAVREVCELLLKAQGHWDDLLRKYEIAENERKLLEWWWWARSGPGVLHELTGVIAHHNGDIASVSIIEEQPESRIYFEINLPEAPEILQADLANAARLFAQVDVVKTLQKVYGKRIIIVGGGAQVGQVAIGAISEADRHNIRGEHISVDTIPLVGEQALADAVRAVGTIIARPRAWCWPAR